jgi:Cellulase (glycosyl hydrolase family 5)
VAAEESLPGTRHRHRAPRNRHTGIVAAAVALPVILAAALWGMDRLDASSPVAATSISPAAVYRACPLKSCAAYPVPSQVRGLTIAALQNYLSYGPAVRAQIRAAQGWDVNAIRVQIVQDKLVGASGHRYPLGYERRYMTNIQHIVTDALDSHLNVILNAQTELTVGYSANENLPTAATYAFWRAMTRYYGNNPHVVFDLFNEPRYCNWAMWTRSMQSLVDYVRHVGSRNQLWVEGLWWGSTFAGLPHLLSGQGIVYTFHHPGAPWPWQGWLPGYQPGVTGPPLWNVAFGDLAARGVPMVNGEFVNYIGGYYWPHSTQMVSQYMRYLAARHIGMVAWTLQPGVMTANKNLGSAVSEPQGAGRLVWRYFHHRSLPPGPYRVETVPWRFDRSLES